MKKFIISVETSFKASHSIVMNGKHEANHAHPWKVQAQFEARKLDKDGITVDFAVLNKTLKDLAKKIAGKKIDRIPPFNKINPTTEQIARWFFEGLSQYRFSQCRVLTKRSLMQRKPVLLNVTVWEGPENSITYRR